MRFFFQISGIVIWAAILIVAFLYFVPVRNILLWLFKKIWQRTYAYQYYEYKKFLSVRDSKDTTITDTHLLKQYLLVSPRMKTNRYRQYYKDFTNKEYQYHANFLMETHNESVDVSPFLFPTE